MSSNGWTAPVADPVEATPIGELLELRRDRARLEWLYEHSRHVREIGGGRWAICEWDGGTWIVVEGCATWRGAIDKAMAVTGNG